VAFIVMVAKPVISGVIVHVLHQPSGTVATIAPGLGQIGEFSFIVAVLGRTLGLLPDEGYQLIICASIISIALNPLLFSVTESLMKRRIGADGPAEGLLPDGGEEGAGVAPPVVVATPAVRLSVDPAV